MTLMVTGCFSGISLIQFCGILSDTTASIIVANQPPAPWVLGIDTAYIYFRFARCVQSVLSREPSDLLSISKWLSSPRMDLSSFSRSMAMADNSSMFDEILSLEGVSARSSRCVYCKGSKLLCGKERCSVIARFYSDRKSTRLNSSHGYI